MEPSNVVSTETLINASFSIIATAGLQSDAQWTQQYCPGGCSSHLHKDSTPRTEGQRLRLSLAGVQTCTNLTFEGAEASKLRTSVECGATSW